MLAVGWIVFARAARKSSCVDSSVKKKGPWASSAGLSFAVRAGVSILI